MLGLCGVPQGIINVISAMYKRVVAFAADEEKTRLFEVQAGIPQGCLLSGSIFVIAINPLLAALS